MNTTIKEDLFDKQSPVSCSFLRIVSVYLIMIFVSSISANSMLIWTLVSNKKFRTSLNIFIITLAVVNLLATIVEVPFVIVSNISCKWMFKQIGCIGSGSLMYFSGCTGIYLMAAISFERFYIVYRPFEMRSIGIKANLLGIVGSITNGLFWAVVPMFGWSYYSLEGALTSCSVEWEDRDFNVVSYNIAIFAVVYFFPLVVIIVTGAFLIVKVKNLPNLTELTKKDDQQAQKRLQKERKLTVIVLFMTLFFIISWTPYAIVSLIKAFVDTNLHPVTTLIPASFAKLAIVWPALFFIITNRSIRNHMSQSFKRKSNMSRSKSVKTQVSS